MATYQWINFCDDFAGTREFFKDFAGSQAANDARRIISTLPMEEAKPIISRLASSTDSAQSEEWNAKYQQTMQHICAAIHHPNA